MRVVVAFFVASLVTACGEVPDLRFGDETDGGIGESLDATVVLTADGSIGTDSSSPTGDSSTPITNGDASTDGSSPPLTDSGSDGGDPCPNHPSFGLACCGAMECRLGSFSPCDCNSCTAQCKAGQACCMDKMGRFQKCEPTIAQCPKP